MFLAVGEFLQKDRAFCSAVVAWRIVVTINLQQNILGPQTNILAAGSLGLDKAFQISEASEAPFEATKPPANRKSRTTQDYKHFPLGVDTSECS